MFSHFLLVLAALHASAADVVDNVGDNPWWYCDNPSWLYFNGNCYSSPQTSADFFGAQFGCAGSGATLAIIESSAENNFVVTQAGCSSSPVWINLVYTQYQDGPEDTPGNWKWGDGSTVSYSNWNPNSRSYNTGNSYPCASASTDQMWYSNGCYTLIQYVCKKASRATLAPGLTAPKIPEILKDSQGCLPGWVRFEDRCYFSDSTIQKDFFGAQMFCRFNFGSVGADLLAVNTWDENTFAFRTLMNCSYDYCSRQSTCPATWLGLVNLDDSHLEDTSAWAWEDNSAMTANFWQAGFPTTTYSWLQCGVMVSPGAWINTDCYEVRPFVCEAPVNSINVMTTTPSVQLTTVVEDPTGGSTQAPVASEGTTVGEATTVGTMQCCSDGRCVTCPAGSVCGRDNVVGGPEC